MGHPDDKGQGASPSDANPRPGPVASGEQATRSAPDADTDALADQLGAVSLAKLSPGNMDPSHGQEPIDSATESDTGINEEEHIKEEDVARQETIELIVRSLRAQLHSKVDRLVEAATAAKEKAKEVSPVVSLSPPRKSEDEDEDEDDDDAGYGSYATDAKDDTFTGEPSTSRTGTSTGTPATGSEKTKEAAPVSYQSTKEPKWRDDAADRRFIEQTLAPRVALGAAIASSEAAEETYIGSQTASKLPDKEEGDKQDDTDGYPASTRQRSDKSKKAKRFNFGALKLARKSSPSRSASSSIAPPPPPSAVTPAPAPAPPRAPLASLSAAVSRTEEPTATQRRFQRVVQSPVAPGATVPPPAPRPLARRSHIEPPGLAPAPQAEYVEDQLSNFRSLPEATPFSGPPGVPQAEGVRPSFSYLLGPGGGGGSALTTTQSASIDDDFQARLNALDESQTAELLNMAAMQAPNPFMPMMPQFSIGSIAGSTMAFGLAHNAFMRQDVSLPDLDSEQLAPSSSPAARTQTESVGGTPDRQEARGAKHEQALDEGAASDHDGRRKKQRRAPTDKALASGSTKKFACPYFKRNRKKYSKWTSCPGPGWDEVHRVKTHLYRRHALPTQCPRCWEIFKADNLLSSHLQQNPPCVTRENHTLVEGFTKDQEKKLRSRKKAQADTTDEDKWREIYLILFPDDDPGSIPSPYYDSTDYEAEDGNSPRAGELEDYASFVKREMPTLVRRELETLFQDEFQDVEERLRPRVADIVLKLQGRLLGLYKQSQTPLSEYGPPNDIASASDQGLTPALSNRTDTGTDNGSTPVTEGGVPQTDNFQFDNTAIFDFDPAGIPLSAWDFGNQQFEEPEYTTTGFSWDNEFDRLINPGLFLPQAGRSAGYVQPEGSQQVPRSDGAGWYHN